MLGQDKCYYKQYIYRSSVDEANWCENSYFPSYHLIWSNIPSYSQIGCKFRHRIQTFKNIIGCCTQ
jgi:hypothetical protein